ncbi:response regulator [Massilia sp. TS11]|uniref:response regulator n=1 Tax=Massilia sp. TS11 TaxID=2908003 RepID=UPI001EDAE5E9|nr:response regulator [Massilia sp. TS11]MCG2583970.1 response regulator [Massilia sp. TS11]
MVPIRVLIVEDDLVDRIACRRAFAADSARQFDLIEADSGQRGLELCLAQAPDCVLLDYHLPDLTGLEFLARLVAQTPAGELPVPVMMLTGADSAAVAAEAMRNGARDYLVKDVDGTYLDYLPGAIERMLREQRLMQDKHQLEAKFRTLVEQIQAITYIATLGEPASLQYISPQIRSLGYSPGEWLAHPDWQRSMMHPDDRQHAWQAITAARIAGTPLRTEYRLFARSGQALWFRDQAEVVLDPAGKPLFMQGLLVDITASKHAEQALRSSQAELRKLAAHQEAIKEDERKRIAREIHDELGGLLTGIRAYISVVLQRAEQEGKTADPLLSDAAGLTQTAIETVRRVISDLRPSVLDQLGVWAALEWYGEQIRQRAGLDCECELEPEVSAVELDPERSTMVFRIVQEALTNVVKHAKATRVRCRAALEGAQLLLTIEDNGRGIDTERLLNRDSFGILGMHERTRRFNGELKIMGRPGQGTLLELRLPLKG